MHQTLLGTHTVVPAGPVIKDEITTKHFGVLLSTQQSIEEFQIKSGMRKAFTTEYQYHYWALVARIRVGEEVLDIAIPTVMFNYRQEVSGAAVSFHLNDVEAASNATAEIAGVYANVLAGSSFAKYLNERFGSVEWMNVPMNTCHVHPGMMSTFSGTDYSKTINDPGICFPLSEPQDQPSFSSIVCHDTTKKHIAKIVRTEYRFANRDGNVISYKHGQCISYWRGYEGTTKEISYPPIQSLFKNKTNDLVYEIEPFPSYVTTDGANIVIKDNELMEEIFAKFDELEFSPNTENIKPENIVTRVYANSYYGNQSYYGQNKGSLNSAVGNSQQAPSIAYIEQTCINAGYNASEVKKWTYKELNDIYRNLENFKKITVDATDNMPEELKKLYEEETHVNAMYFGAKKQYLIANKIATEADLHMISQKELDLKIGDYFDNLIEEAEMKFLRESKASSTTDGEIAPNDANDIDVENLIIALPIDKKCKYLLDFGIDAKDISGKKEAELNGMILGLVREFDTGHEDDDNIVLEDLIELYVNENPKTAANSILISSENTTENNFQQKLSSAGSVLPIDPKNNKSVRTFLIQYGVAEEVFETLGNDEIYALLEEFNW